MHLPLDYFSTEARLTFHVSELKSDINYIKYYTFLTRYNNNKNNTDAILPFVKKYARWFQKQSANREINRK